MIHHGDCLDVMATLDAESIAAIVTDPPYDLLTTSRNGSRRINNPDNAYGRTGKGFMGKTWDGTGIAFRVETWAECFRLAKPGAHLLAFGGTRTYHRMTAAIEDAGWEIRDCLVWGYASGFPKSLNLDGDWKGWGTALKPAWEPIVMARKPIGGTVKANVEAHGTGALNIDGTRIGTEAIPQVPGELGRHGVYGTMRRERGGPTVNALGDGLNTPTFSAPNPLGRWPANVILTDPIFDGGIQGVVGGGETNGGGLNHLLRRGGTTGAGLGYGSSSPEDAAMVGYDDSGTYSRFFLIPKADRADREPVAGGLESARVSSKPDGRQWDIPGSHSRDRANNHPTVKPTDLMRHLVRLVTPPGGTVLDPFLGSGTTALAAEMEGFAWIGIEKEAEYVRIAEARLNGTQRGMGLSA